jgi:Circadian oscillating protein COP23
MQFYTVNLNKAFSISIFWTILSIVSIPQSSVRAGDFYIFECQQNSQTGIFATVVKKRPSGKTKEIILWKSMPSPQKDCYAVSDRLKKFWDEGNLNWIVISRSNLPSGVIICGFRDKNSSNVCDEQHKIFTLSKAMNPQDAYKKLMRNLIDSTEPSIYQNSDDDITIDFKASIEQQSANR